MKSHNYISRDILCQVQQTHKEENTWDSLFGLSKQRKLLPVDVETL